MFYSYYQDHRVQIKLYIDQSLIISDLLSEHEECLSVDVVVCDLACDHGVEAGEGGHQVGQPHRTQVLEVVTVQVSQLLRQEVGVLYGEGWRIYLTQLSILSLKKRSNS